MDLLPRFMDLAHTAMSEWFTDTQPVPPLGGGVEVMTVAGETPPVPDWFGQDGDCGDGLLWLRVVRRFRSVAFPDEARRPEKCGTSPCAEIEAGVMRCVPYDLDAEGWEAAAHAQWDDSWRLHRALCAAALHAHKEGVVIAETYGVGTPAGPDGLAVAWTQNLIVQLGG